MKNSNDTTGNRIRSLSSSSFNSTTKFASAYMRKNINYFSSQIYLISVANLLQFCNETPTVMTATARRYSTHQSACWYRLFTADRGTGSDPSICFALTSRVLPPKNIKSIRELVMFKDKKRYPRSFI